MLRPNKINLVARLRDNPEREAEGRARMRLLLPFAAIIVATLAVSAVYILGVQASLDREYDELSAYMSSHQSVYAEALTRSKEAEALAQKNIELARVFSAVDSHGELDRALFDGLYLAADRCDVSIEAFSFDRARGQLRLSCVGTRITAASDYIKILDTLDHVSDAEYSGYTQQAGEVPLYSFEITCGIEAKGGGGND